MFETIKQNIQKICLIKSCCLYYFWIAIALNPSAVFHFIGYPDHRLSCFAWVLNLLRLTVLKGKQVLGVSVCLVVFFS